MKTNTKWVFLISISILMHLFFFILIREKKFIDKKVKFEDQLDVFIKQLVIIDEDSDEAYNDQAKYLSKSNKKVLEEKKAKEWGEPKNIKPSISRNIFNQDSNAYLKELAEESLKKNKVSSTYDFLPDVKTGSETVLNTAEFIYYSFYRRIELAIVPLWNSEIKNYLASYSDLKSALNAIEYITDVEIILDEKGNFETMRILKSSGVSGFDLAPGTAFMQASPFFNPPEGIVSQDGYIRMNWRFVISFNKSYRFGVKYLDPFRR